MNLKTVEVILPLAIRATYTYSIPDAIEYPPIGTRVLVPVGKKMIVGIVLQYNSHNESISLEKIRPIQSILDSQPMVSSTQLRLWQWIASYYMCPIGDVMAAALPSLASDPTYYWGESSRRRVRLVRYSNEVEPLLHLSSYQEQARNAILTSWSSHNVVLLYGVTSSGKTEIYMHLIAEQLKQGKQVLYLVPEIALTTQLTERLQRFFGNQLCVYHSRISEGQRMEIYRQLSQSSSTKLIVGARSAVFLPFQHLGLVIVDEEHEVNYKQQDPAPRYNARSVAIMLACYTKAKVLLGTATPAIETYFNALSGKYGLVMLTKRYADIELPFIRLVDLNQQYKRKEMCGHLSDFLVKRIGEELEHGKQVLLFQNRRGYAPMLLCSSCGKPPQCPGCDVPLTLHLHEHKMRCHYCGYTTSIPTQCSDCGGVFTLRGFGTERVEDEIQSIYPTVRIARMDLDTTRKKDDHQRIIDAFARHEIDVLIGTQMVTKGLHFDDVSLVGVLQADSLWSQPSYHSSERAYQMLEQVAGRAGRTGKQGEVIIQAWDVHHPIFYRLNMHDYNGFYNSQIIERESFHYPPFYRIIMIILRHTDLLKLNTTAHYLEHSLSHTFGNRCSKILFPSVSRVNGQHFCQFRIRIETSANIDNAKQLLLALIRDAQTTATGKSTTIYFDVDPMA